MVQISPRIIVVIIACYISTIPLVAQRMSSVVLSASVREGLGRRAGLDFALQNIETKDIYDSQPLKYLMSKHSVVSGLPTGSYHVIFLGRLTEYPIVDTVVQQFFGTIKIESGSHYYLGFLNGRVLSKENALRVVVCEGDISRLESKLRAESVLRGGENLTALSPYREDVLILTQ